MAAVQPDIVSAPPLPPQAEPPAEVTFRPEGVFDGASAWELRRTIEQVREQVSKVVIDFSRVREFYDFGVAVLAHGLAQRKDPAPEVLLKGLRTHQLRMFRYFGIDADR